MSTVLSRQTHIEQVLVEVTSLLVERARVQLEHEVEDGRDSRHDLERMHQAEKELRAIRRELGLPESPSDSPPPAGRQVSKFFEVPGQEDA
jgi:hypothetical protein